LSPAAVLDRRWVSSPNEGCPAGYKEHSFSVTADVIVPAGGAGGVLVAQGGVAGGWSFYLKDVTPKYCYNFVGLQQYYVEAGRAVPKGAHQVRMEFAYDGGGLAKGGTVTLYIDGDAVGKGRVEITQPVIFSADETTDVGKETGSVVTPDYGITGNAFTGKINWIQIDVGKDDHDHLITEEERYRVAMSRQ